MAEKTPTAIPVRARARKQMLRVGGRSAPRPSPPRQRPHRGQLQRGAVPPPRPHPAVAHNATALAQVTPPPQRQRRQLDRPQALRAEAPPPPTRRRCARQRTGRRQTPGGEVKGAPWQNERETKTEAVPLGCIQRARDRAAAIHGQDVADQPKSTRLVFLSHTDPLSLKAESRGSTKRAHAHCSSPRFRLASSS